MIDPHQRENIWKTRKFLHFSSMNKQTNKRPQTYINESSISVCNQQFQVREATISAQDLKSMMAEDGLVTNMRISGDLQGVSQFIMSAASVLASQSVEEKNNDVTGGDGKLSQLQAKKERKEVRLFCLNIITSMVKTQLNFQK